MFEGLKQKNDDIIISYMGLRKFLGILGIFLPFLCIIGGFVLGKYPAQQSISVYYYTNMRDLLEGVLIVVGFFLLTYRGYQKIDTLVSISSGIAGISIGVFPTEPLSKEIIPIGIFQINSNISFIIHLTSASLFFLLLALNSLFLFTKDGGSITPEKKLRNLVYRVCGIVMLICLVIMIGSTLPPFQEFQKKYNLIFNMELISLVFFGFSWLVKGEAILKDK